MYPQLEMFKKLVWTKNRMLLDDLVFRVEDDATEGGEQAGEESVCFLKPKRMIDQYEKLWQARKDFDVQSILELGIYDGGGVLFWFECFQPKKMVGVDIIQGSDSKLLRRYLASRGSGDRIKLYWETSQTDSERLKQITASEFSAPLDLVIDDASHVYQLTKTSFETLFPLLRPGGLYIIEDWSWACWSGLPADFYPAAGPLPAGMVRAEVELPQLIFEIVQTTGKMEHFVIYTDGLQTLKPLIANVSVFPDFVVVERGEAEAAPGDFKLEQYSTRPRKGLCPATPGLRAAAMKAYTEYLTMDVPSKMAFVNITPQVQESVRKSGVAEGLVLINSMHITSSVFIDDDERGLHHDFGAWLEKLAPFNPDPNVYHHNRTGEDNADAHLKRQVMGREVVVAITKGKLDFGPSEQIIYGEFDGQRAKRVLVKVIGE